jgi:hypothetical protein
MKEFDDSTYDEFSSRWRTDQLKNRIKTLFKDQAFYQAENLWDILSDVPRFTAVHLLTNIVDNKNFQVQHGDLSGYIRYCNNYYIFQPNVYADLSIPLAIRVGKFPIKRDVFTPIEFEMPEIVEEKQEIGGTVETFWKAMDEWCTTLSTNTAFDIPGQIDSRIVEKAQYDDEKKEKYAQIVEMIGLFHASFHKSLNKNPEAFRKTILFYLWDEWLTLEEKKFLVYSTDLNTLECIEENQYILGRVVVNRFINPTNGEVEYMCKGSPCASVIIDTIKDDQDDFSLRVNTSTTGPIYGFLVPKNGEIVFKTAEPPEEGEPKRGKQCSNVSNTIEHIKNLIKIGDILKMNGKSDFDLNREMIGTRKIKNSTRACTLMNLLIRFLDADKIQNKRWFYRPVASIYTGHKGLFRLKKN